jgi:ribosomal protein L7/L12
VKDTRDPIKLYDAIKKVQEVYGISVTEAADIVDELYNEMRNNNGNANA